MKKKIFVVMILICFPLILINANPLEFYSDFNRGYNGWAGAVYWGTTEKYNPAKIAEGYRNHTKSTLVYRGSCEKLSNEERFLMWHALDEYNVQTNEIYSIAIQQSNYQVLGLVVVINENGKNCDWCSIGYFTYKW